MASVRATVLLIASLLMAVTLTDARLTVQSDINGGYAVKDAKPVPLLCAKVHGVQACETCFSIAKSAGLTLAQFLAFNPNINCEKVFVAQWVCLSAITI